MTRRPAKRNPDAVGTSLLIAAVVAAGFVYQQHQAIMKLRAQFPDDPRYQGWL